MSTLFVLELKRKAVYFQNYDPQHKKYAHEHAKSISIKLLFYF